MFRFLFGVSLGLGVGFVAGFVVGLWLMIKADRDVEEMLREPLGQNQTPAESASTPAAS